MDADAIFTSDRRIEEFIDSSSSIVFTKDHGPSTVNAGVILFKNDEYTDKFLKLWWSICYEYPKYKSGMWFDQTCIGILMKIIDMSKVSIISNDDLNSRVYSEDKFIFHAFAYGSEPYRTLDIIHRLKFPDGYTPMESIIEEPTRLKLIVYHIYCVNNYIDIVKEQVERLLKSGLYDWCDRFEVCCTDVTNEFIGIDEQFQGLTKVNINKTDKNSYEYWPIKLIWNISQENPGEVLYFHTKGVSNTYKNIVTKEISDRKTRGIKWWREIMEHFLIDNYKDCIEALQSSDHCGVTCNQGWYWGNFWWSNLKFIKDNESPTLFGDRWYFEAWLNYGRQYTSHEFYHFEFNSYYSDLPSDIYLKELYKDSKLEVISAFYGTLGEQQDEGRPAVDRVVVDVTEVIKNNLATNNYRGFNIVADNNMAGDPYYGVQKMLEIYITIDNRECILVVNEGRALNFIL